MATIVAVAVGLALAAWLLGRRRRAEPQVERGPEAISPSDAADLAALFASVDVEHASERLRRLALVVQPLVDRAVPARVVEAVPGLSAARIRFADGTTVVVRGGEPGDVGILAMWVGQRSMAPSAWRTDPEGAHLVFRAPGRKGTLSVLVTGLDQPD